MTLDRSRLLSPSVALQQHIEQPEQLVSNDPSTLRVRCRMLTSCTYLEDCFGRVLWIPEAVLQAAVPLFDGAPLKIDHDRSVLATVGRMVEPRWVEATDTVPGGIEVVAEIKRPVSTDAEAVAQLLMAGLIHCTSAGFSGEWEWSHPDLDEDQRFALYGREHEGRRVCEHLTRLSAVHEASFVDRGGDPHSRRLRAPEEEYTMAAMTPAALVAAILPLLELPPDTSMEEVMAALGRILMGKDPKKAEEPEPAPAPAPAPAEMAGKDAQRLLAALGKATVDEAVAEVIRMKTDFVPRSAAPSQVAVALAEGRITPAERAGLESFEKIDPAGLKVFLAGRPVNGAVNLGAPQANPAQPKPLPEVASKDLEQKAKAIGADPADVARRLEMLRAQQS